MQGEEARNVIEVLKERSYYRCLGEGLSLAFTRFGVMWGFLWPSVVVWLALGVVSFFLQRMVYFDALAGEVWAEQAWTLGAMVVAVALSLVFHACLVWQQRALVAGGALPGARVWRVWREVLPVYWRVLKLFLVCLIVGAVLTALGCWLYALAGIAHPLAVGGFALAVAVVLVVVLALFVLVAFEYLFGGASLMGALRKLARARRHMGRTLLLVFVCLLLGGLLTLVMSMPAIVCSWVDGMALSMRMEGDLDDLPSFYPLVLAVSWTLSVLGTCLSTLVCSFPLLLNWGALRAFERTGE